LVRDGSDVSCRRFWEKIIEKEGARKGLMESCREKKQKKKERTRSIATRAGKTIRGGFEGKKETPLAWPIVAD